MATDNSTDCNTASVDLPELSPRWLEILYYSMGVPIAVCVCLLNVLFVIASHRHPTLRSTTRVLANSLSVSEILAGTLLFVHLVLIPFQNAIGKLSPISCLIWALCLVFPVVSNVFHSSVICWERYYAVLNTGLTQSSFTITLELIFVWIYSAVLTLSGILFTRDWSGINSSYSFCDWIILPKYHMLMLIGHLSITFVLNLLVVVKIHCVLKDHQRTIQVSNTITYAHLIEDVNTAYLFFSGYLLLCFLWLPLIIAMAVYLARITPYESIIAIRILFLIGSLAGLKPVWYAYKDSSFRNAIRQVLGCLQATPRHSISHSYSH